ncbi:anti-sigma factor domain-containing protein [Nocardioides sp. CFH 31398]|uniref:anti-sigma factor n=1 Tax=Nocardioides sp. CFH 31398 TaxID=2919579 RepID=UPI001F05BC7B|nr:anti-sigma factor [Nocardioides sp. CFH 31398]MCH1867967.1 anti-sigma factor [Nocardioides sp. CFH 31398]
MTDHDHQARDLASETELSHALVGAYAVDALDESERTLFERHLAACPDCQAEVATLQEAAGVLASTSLTTPPPGLRRDVLAQIGTIRPLPPLPVQPTLAERRDELAARRGRRRRWTSTVAGVAAAAVLAVGLGVTQPWVDQPDELSPAQQVLQADDARSTSVELGKDVRATVVHSDTANSSVIRTENMPPPPTDRVYQLWYERDGVFEPAGLMPVAEDQTVQLNGEARGADGVGITVEPEGGSEEPTSEPIAEFDFGPAA